jgi:DNA-binding beta-propeller fold protein YncE
VNLPPTSVRFGFAFAKACLGAWLGCAAPAPADTSNAFVNFETAPIHPLALSPNGGRLAVCNIADGRLELFDVSSGVPVPLASVAVGIDPVSVRFRTSNEVWVVNHISDSISVVDLDGRRIVATLQTLDTPADVVFAGSPLRAFVSCAMPNTVQVFDADTRQVVTNLLIDADRPKALAVSPDGQRVYAAIFESGNATTLVGGTLAGRTFISNVVNLPNGPYRGQNPPPNSGTNFSPRLNPSITNLAPPKTGLIVRKNAAGRWMDDNQGDWTEFVSGTNAPFNRRVPGWDLADRDLAVIDTRDLSVSYARGLMNICMDLAVNPASGQIAVVGTDAINEVRFEPNLNGIFVRTKIALVDPATLESTVKDLNPHLDYIRRTLPTAERDKSLGDPRGIVWNSSGSRGYVTGMGSHNLVTIDAEGNRVRSQSIELGDGPSGLALDEARKRLYVLNRFSSSLSALDTDSDSVIGTVQILDPTPRVIRTGRRHFYDTRKTSGLGQASCATCHPDARMDRLAWDLGDPAGALLQTTRNHFGAILPLTYHPMKGVMVTQTLQDIIGHEPFHWRGDRPDLESFNQTFTNLQAAPAALPSDELKEFKAFLATIRFPPNPYRTFENGLSTNVPLAGHSASGLGTLPAGAPLPNGSAVAGVSLFVQKSCAACHSLPTGLGIDLADGRPIPPGTNGEHHVALADRLEGGLLSKMSQFRNLPDKVGMDGSRIGSRAGFGFSHDGSTDTLTHFLEGEFGGSTRNDQEAANLVAFLLSLSGSDLGGGGPNPPSPFLPGLPSQDVPAAVGKQVTLNTPGRTPLFDEMVALAGSPTSRVDLIAKGPKDGLGRGWSYDRSSGRFQSDRQRESRSSEELVALAGPGNELTLTVVARGTGRRLGIDRDLDGVLDQDELDAGTNPADLLLPVTLQPAQQPVVAGSDVMLQADPGLAPATWDFQWQRDGQFIPGATSATLLLTNVPVSIASDYTVIAANSLSSLTSAPVRITVVPLLVGITPAGQNMPPGSNAVFAAVATGAGPFAYQWRFNGADLPDANNVTLTLTNVQLADQGFYSILVSNVYGCFVTDAVFLGVLIQPVILIPPLSQTVAEGADATFSVAISGSPPPFGYQLLSSSIVVTNYVSDESSAFLTWPNVQRSNAGLYRILITNAANFPLGIASGPVSLTVLADSDRDGLPDVWEAAHGLATNDASDATLDADSDRATNWQEYHAGTDPRDPQSYPTIDSIEQVGTAPGRVKLSFVAISNHTYTIQSRDAVGTGTWTRLLDCFAYPTNRVEQLTNQVPPGINSRLYRLVTPRAP